MFISYFIILQLLAISHIQKKKSCHSEYIKIDRDKSTFKSHRDFDSEIEMTLKHF